MNAIGARSGERVTYAARPAALISIEHAAAIGGRFGLGGGLRMRERRRQGLPWAPRRDDRCCAAGAEREEASVAAKSEGKDL